MFKLIRVTSPCAVLHIYLFITLLSFTYANYDATTVKGFDENCKDLRSMSEYLLQIQKQLFTLQESMDKMSSDQLSIREKTTKVTADKGFVLTPMGQIQSDMSQIRDNIETQQRTIGQLLPIISTMQTEKGRPKSVNYQGLSEIGNLMFAIGNLLRELGIKMEHMERHMIDMVNTLLDNGAQPQDVRRRVVNLANMLITIGLQLADIAEPLANIGMKILDISDRTNDAKEVLKDIGQKLLDVGQTVVDQGQKTAGNGKPLADLARNILVLENEREDEAYSKNSKKVTGTKAVGFETGSMDLGNQEYQSSLSKRKAKKHEKIKVETITKRIVQNMDGTTEVYEMKVIVNKVT